jgi:hypothetical protein
MSETLKKQESITVSKLLQGMDLVNAREETKWERLTDSLGAELRNITAVLFAVDQLYVELDSQGDHRGEFYDSVAYLIILAKDMTTDLGEAVDQACLNIKQTAYFSPPVLNRPPKVSPASAAPKTAD